MYFSALALMRMRGAPAPCLCLLLIQRGCLTCCTLGQTCRLLPTHARAFLARTGCEVAPQFPARPATAFELVRDEENEGKGVGFDGAAGVVGMEVVAAVVSGEELRGTGRVAQNFVQIDDGIEFAATKNPGIDPLARGFAPCCVEIIDEAFERGMFECRIGCADDANTFFVSARD